MSDNTHLTLRETKVGETAVDGLMAGIVAGIGMALYLVLAGLLSGLAPAVMLGRFDPGMSGGWLTGLIAHLAVSSIYGVVFALLLAAMVRIRPSLQRFDWLVGLVYGLILLAMARGVLLPMAGSPMLQIPSVHLLIAHAVYGLVLGFIVGRN